MRAFNWAEPDRMLTHGGSVSEEGNNHVTLNQPQVQCASAAWQVGNLPHAPAMTTLCSVE